MWEIFHFLIFSGQAWILAMTRFKEKQVRAIGREEVSGRLSMVRLYVRLEGLKVSFSFLPVDQGIVP